MIIKHLYNSKDELVATAYFKKGTTATIRYKDEMQPQNVEVNVNKFNDYRNEEGLFLEDERGQGRLFI